MPLGRSVVPVLLSRRIERVLHAEWREWLESLDILQRRVGIFEVVLTGVDYDGKYTDKQTMISCILVFHKTLHKETR